MVYIMELTSRHTVTESRISQFPFWLALRKVGLYVDYRALWGVIPFKCVVTWTLRSCHTVVWA